MLGPLTTLLLSLIPLASAADFLPTKECPLLGPTFSSDFDISKTEAFARARASFPKTIESLIDSGVVGTDVSFLIDVYSTKTNESIYTYTHEATEPLLNETITKGKIDDETLFRIGSVSKMYTAYAILAHAGGLEVMDHSVTKYLPELAGNREKDPLKFVIWEDITVGALMSQQAGSGQFC
jgi:CubicO group peptidase (beta-lactamase class C family)